MHSSYNYSGFIDLMKDFPEKQQARTPALQAHRESNEHDERLAADYHREALLLRALQHD